MNFDWDTVSGKGLRLGARCHKINNNFFSVGGPPQKIM